MRKIDLESKDIDIPDPDDIPDRYTPAITKVIVCNVFLHNL